MGAYTYDPQTCARPRALLARLVEEIEPSLGPIHSTVAFDEATRSANAVPKPVEQGRTQGRLERHIDELNAEPVVLKWTYGIEDAIRVWANER